MLYYEQNWCYQAHGQIYAFSVPARYDGPLDLKMSCSMLRAGVNACSDLKTLIRSSARSQCVPVSLSLWESFYSSNILSSRTVFTFLCSSKNRESRKNDEVHHVTTFFSKFVFASCSSLGPCAVAMFQRQSIRRGHSLLEDVIKVLICSPSCPVGTLLVVPAVPCAS